MILLRRVAYLGILLIFFSFDAVLSGGLRPKRETGGTDGADSEKIGISLGIGGGIGGWPGPGPVPGGWVGGNVGPVHAGIGIGIPGPGWIGNGPVWNGNGGMKYLRFEY